MKIKMRNLFLLDYKEEKRQYERFRDELATDIFVNNYLSKNLYKELTIPSNLERVTINNGYVVSSDGRKLIGYVRFCESEFVDFLQLHYAIHPKYRKIGYGTQLLREATIFSFQNFPKCVGIELLIHLENKKSKRIADSLGYQKLENKKIYQYVKRRN